MKLCDSYRCKRLALGMSQGELGELIGVTQNTISRFESGEEVSKPVFNAIRLGVENYITNLEREKYLRTRILEAVYSLEYQSEQEQLKTLSHMQVHMGKLSLDLLQPKEIEL